MGTTYDEITDSMRTFVEAQHVFFVATAPVEGAHVNLSPKGLESFRILDAHTVAYLDLTGSGAETIAHVEENGRITFMFCAFDGKPNIVRFYGTGSVHFPDTKRFAELSSLFPPQRAVRSIITASIHRTSNSCGYAVPLMDFVEDRSTLSTWARSKTEADLVSYWAEKNATSIDGLPAVPAATG